MNTFDGCCGSCIHMNTNEYVSHKDHCYCTYRRQYYNLTERKCSYYEYDRYKDYYELNHRWHIVSAVLGILNVSAAEAGIEKLHSFRTDVLEKDPRYESALRIYDVIGPFLAGRLAHEPDAPQICRQLIEKWLLPMEDMLALGGRETVYRKYAEMVNRMADRYAEALDGYCRQKGIPPCTMRMRAV